MKLTPFAAALLLAPLTMAAHAEVTFTPFGTYQWFDNQTVETLDHTPVAPDIKKHEGYALALGYRYTPAFGVEVNYGHTKSGLDTFPESVRNSRLSVDGYYAFNTDHAFNPYVLLGVGQTRLKAFTGETNADTMVEAGIGAFYRFNQYVALRMEARDVHNTDNNLDDQLAMVGLEFSGADSTKAAPAPMPVVQEQAPAPVEQLAAAPAKPADSDNDGVPDAQDQCPNTPAGVAVDAAGCPLDSDKDGVPDYKDKCPDTKAGAAVDENGCYLTLKQEVEINLDVHFASGKADIQGDATAEIQKVADFMKQYPNVNVTIEGHTDNRGNAAKNKALSQKRAEAVKAEIVKLGVDGSRLSAVGYGSSKPIADNKTEEGRAKNRRVVASAKAQSESIKMKK
ncbi:MAG TPA: OmpA family protein [Moraxellaceae bacterium]|nr:OmpA family protein [Moraxellaceae bacterium]